MFFPPFNEEQSRYERKFLVTDMNYHNIAQQVRLHPSAFTEIFYPRYVNNIYLDSNDFDFFQDNVAGKGRRKKVRIRWYGELAGYVEKPVLEFKMREGMLGNKISYRLMPFWVNDQLDTEVLSDTLLNSDLPVWAQALLIHLKPSLLNRYKRQYYSSFDEKFRITLDEEMSYYALGTRNNNFMERYSTENVIVELKYDRKYDDLAPVVTNHIPFRLTKSSKYVNGIDLLHPAIT